MAPEHAPVLHSIGAVVAPVGRMLTDEQQQERAMNRASKDQPLQQNRQLSRQLGGVEQKLAHFYPLMTVAMAQSSQQMHGVAQFLAAGFENGANVALVPFLVSSSQSTRHRGKRFAMRMMLDM